MQYSLFAADPALWHLASIVLEAIVTLVLFAFLLLQFRRCLPAFVGALFFATSPLAAEVAGWVSASDEALCALLILLALSALALAANIAQPRRVSLLRWLSVALLVLAVLAKETAVVGVLLALAYELLLLPAPRRATLTRVRIFAIPLAAFFLTHHSLRTPQADSSPHPPAQVLTAMLSAALLGLRKLLWPLPVSEFYDIWFAQPHSATSLVLEIAILLLLAAAALWIALRSRFAAWSLLVVALPLAAAVAGVAFFRDYDLFHDRYLYLSFTGLAMLLGAAVARLSMRPRLLAPVLALCVLILGAQAWAAHSVSRQFSSDMALASNAVHVAPHNIVAWQLLADTQLEMGDCRTALASAQQAAQLRSDLWKSVFFLGIAESRCGLNAPAAESFTRAAAIPAATTEQVAFAWYELARARIAQGNLPAAQAALRQAAQRDPASSRIRNLLAHISTPQPAP
jgi:tetratricopeptide (TPR) repeat protein